MSAQQQVPISKKVVYVDYIVGIAKEENNPALVYVDPLGVAHVFVLDDDKRKQIMSYLGGAEGKLVIAGANDLPPAGIQL